MPTPICANAALEKIRNANENSSELIARVLRIVVLSACSAFTYSPFLRRDASGRAALSGGLGSKVGGNRMDVFSETYDKVWPVEIDG
jgi:hypothetical protein